MTTVVLLIVVVLFATIATAWAGAVRSASLRRKFESLGVITGRTMEEILRHVGQPHRRVKLGPGRELLFWRRINFRVALTFDAQRCESVEYDSGD